MHDRIVISDVRFDNEAIQLSKMGGYIWRIERKNAASVNAHESENGVNPQWIDCIINNDSTINNLIEHAADKLTRAIYGEKAA